MLMSEENKNLTNGEGYNFEGGFEPEEGKDLFSDDEPPKKQKRIKLSTFIISAIALVLATAMFTFTVSQSYFRRALSDIIDDGLVLGGEAEGELHEELELLRSLFETYSYYDLDEEELTDTVMKAYAYATGDRYAEYYTAEEYELLTSDTAGESEGIGINVIYTTVTVGGVEYDAIKVINVTPESPAEKAGVRIGDYIFYVGIDEETRESVYSLGYTMALSKLVGKAGTYAEFTALRFDTDGNFEEMPFSILRAPIETSSVMSRICETDDSVAVIKITEFDLTTPRQLSEKMDAYIDAGIEKFVFDVRYNPGGSLASIVAVLSYFLDEGQTIISEVDKAGNKETIVCAPINSYSDEFASCNVSKKDIGKYSGYSYAVLCNEDTASAAELFTANFRDYSLGKTVGKTTFGKGSMQSTISFEYFGYDGALKLTTRMYFPPCGESYDGIGIEPDISVELSAEAAATNVYELKDADDAQLQAAIKTLN